MVLLQNELFLTNEEVRNNLFLKACQFDRVGLVRFFVQELPAHLRPNIEIFDVKEENNPLLFAVENGCHESAEILLAAGANYEVQNEDGKSTLEMAVGNLDVKIMKLIGNRMIEDGVAMDEDTIEVCREPLMGVRNSANLREGQARSLECFEAILRGEIQEVEEVAVRFEAADEVSEDSDSDTPPSEAVYTKLQIYSPFFT